MSNDCYKTLRQRRVQPRPTKIAQQFDSNAFTPTQREIAKDIFRLMLRDAEVRVVRPWRRI